MGGFLFGKSEMFKRLLVTLGILAGLLSPVYAAGTIPGISMTQQLDQYAKPLSGGLLYLIQAGTTSTPQNCYQDTALTLAYPNPITLDAAGRIPQLFCADGNIKIRLTDKNGVTQLVQDNLLVIGASSGSGGGGSVDATTVLATGDIKARYGAGSLSGFVRANGRTIGSATSGATERANADTQSLFEYLWGADANLTVSGGRGASANADWVANKTIALPDLRGRTIAGLDDMGNSPAGILTSSYFGTDATALGAISTTTDHIALSNANLPPYTPSGTNGTSLGTYPGYNFVLAASSVSTGIAAGGADVRAPSTGSSFSYTASLQVSAPSFTGTPAPGRTSAPFSTVQPTIVMSFYVKL